MKLSEMFIGQLVMMKKEDWLDPRIPAVGKVVDIALEYELSTILKCPPSRDIRILPVIHFVGEDQPRRVNPAILFPYKE